MKNDALCWGLWKKANQEPGLHSHPHTGYTLAPHRPNTRGTEMIKTQTPARRLYLAKESQCVKSLPLPTTRLYICIYYICVCIYHKEKEFKILNDSRGEVHGRKWGEAKDGRNDVISKKLEIIF